ncbi:MAG: hypothetical protein NTX38_01415 [Methylobacter sp.]|nr:hypothetical protein [Methylobacter sp.]
MSIRKFIFCDICNPQGIRSIELRRAPRENQRTGRRLGDGRAWIEGDLNNAVKNRWLCTSDGRHVCPECRAIKKDI